MLPQIHPDERCTTARKPCSNGIINNALPVEILLEMFKQRIGRSTPVGGRLPRTENYLEPLENDPRQDMRVVSQVCRYWRKIALGAPYLWSRLIDCQNLPSPWFEEVLRRASDAPLTVFCRMSDIHVAEAITAQEMVQVEERTYSNLDCLLASGKHFEPH